jgi:transposase
MAARFRGSGRALAGFARSDRLLDYPRPSARRRRKKGGEDHAIGRSRGGLSTKIHVVVDAVGLPVRLLLTPGQASDKTTLPELIAGLRPAREAIADRNLVERFFNKLKHVRRVATRHDKLARNFLAAIALASIRIAIRHYESTT